MAFSIVEQMDSGTVDAQILAYFWYLLEHGTSVFVIGKNAAGKTSFVNTLATMIPSEAKILSIENKRELRLPHSNWLSKSSSTYSLKDENSFFGMLKEGLRQSPDYAIVGEIKGPEAYLAFQGMGSGHKLISTFNAESVDMMVRCLTEPPLELPRILIRNLDVVAVLTNVNTDAGSGRRIKEIAEIDSFDGENNEIKKRIIFRWNPASDSYEKVSASKKVEGIAAEKKIELNDAFEDIEKRKKFLHWINKQKIKDNNKIFDLLNLYSKQLVGIKLDEAEKETMPENKKEKRKERTSILGLLGFKFIKES